VKEDGTVAMDDYDWTGKLTGVVGTRMNDDRVLHPLMDAYNFEKTRMEAYRQGYSTYECFNEQTKELELHIQIEWPWGDLRVPGAKSAKDRIPQRRV
jgi:hypothetical protein